MVLSCTQPDIEAALDGSRSVANDVTGVSPFTSRLQRGTEVPGEPSSLCSRNGGCGSWLFDSVSAYGGFLSSSAAISPASDLGKIERPLGTASDSSTPSLEQSGAMRGVCQFIRPNFL